MADKDGTEKKTFSGPRPDRRRGDRRSVFLILGGIVLAGIAAGYSWLRSLPKD